MGGLEAELVPQFLCPVSSNLQDKVGGGTEGGTGVQSLEGGLRDPSSSVNYDSVTFTSQENAWSKDCQGESSVE